LYDKGIAMTHKEKKQSLLSSVIEFIFLLLVVFLIRTFFFGLYQVPTGSMETTMLVGERFFADKLSYNFRSPRHGEIIAFNDPKFKYSSNPLVKLFQRYVWGPENWTKRVIGVPGDEIRGVIEDGKPVLYRNGEKLDEPYINAFPLILVLKKDMNILLAQIEKDVREMSYGYQVDKAALDNYIQQRLNNETVWKSYDSAVSNDQQPFYRLHEDRIVRDDQGNPELLVPGNPVRPKKGKESADIFTIKLGAGQYWGMGDNRLGSNDCRFFGPITDRDIHGRILFRIWSMDSDESWWIVDLIKHPIDFWSRIRWSRFFQLMN
jgi:signal peptidase I